MAEGSWDLYFYPAFSRSALDSIHQNHLDREGLRWNDGQLSVILNENYEATTTCRLIPMT